jgi:hypothetical protein
MLHNRTLSENTVMMFSELLSSSAMPDIPELPGRPEPGMHPVWLHSTHEAA